MKRNWWWTLGVLLAAIGLVAVPGYSQDYAPPDSVGTPGVVPASFVTPANAPPGGVVYPATPIPYHPPAEVDPRDVVGALYMPTLLEIEYLLWWVKDGGRLSQGLAGVAPVSDFVNSRDGRLQNITPLDSDSSTLDFGAQSGMRLALTHYFDDLQGMGFDASWMQFIKAANDDTFESVNGVLLGPTFNDLDGTRSLVLASFPSSLMIGGRSVNQGRMAEIDIETANRLWGMEANGRMRLPCAFFFDRVWLLSGMRYLDYGEGFGIQTISRPLPGSEALSTIELRDTFTARTRFLGAQIGLHARTQIGRFSLDLIGKSAFGSQCEEVNIHGETVVSSPAGRQKLVGGVLAQRTNIGSSDSLRTAWVNELNIKTGWNFSNSVRATVGYSLLHSNRMARVGNAIDNVDSRSIQVLESFDPTLTPTRPAYPGIQEQYWWAQGLTIGVDWSF